MNDFKTKEIESRNGEEVLHRNVFIFSQNIDEILKIKLAPNRKRKRKKL